MSEPTKRLWRAIDEEVIRCGQHIDLLRDIADDANEEEIGDHQYDALNQIATDLRLTQALLSVLVRVVRASTPQQIYAAFGAPGDYGYETPIGDALARAYGVIGSGE